MEPFIGQIQIIGTLGQTRRDTQVRKDSGEAHLDYLIITMEN